MVSSKSTTRSVLMPRCTACICQPLARDSLSQNKHLSDETMFADGRVKFACEIANSPVCLDKLQLTNTDTDSDLFWMLEELATGRRCISAGPLVRWLSGVSICVSLCLLVLPSDIFPTRGLIQTLPLPARRSNHKLLIFR